MSCSDSGTSFKGLQDPGGTAGNRSALLLKAGVTIGVLGLLASRADWAATGERLSGASPIWVLAGAGASLCALLMAAERWRLSLAAAHAAVPRWTVMRIAFASSFLGQVLPGGLGGDAVRGWLTYRAGGPAQPVITAMILDRVLALAGAVVLLAAALPRLFDIAPPAFAWAAAITTAGLSGGIILGFLVDRFPLPGFLKLDPVICLLRQITRLRRAFLTCAAMKSAASAVAVHLTTVASVACFAAALNLPITLSDALTVVPIAILATALPVSLNGWGMREGAMAAGMALFGVGSGEAVVVSMLLGLTLMLWSLPGGLMWLTLSRKDRQATLPPAMADYS